MSDSHSYFLKQHIMRLEDYIKSSGLELPCIPIENLRELPVDNLIVSIDKWTLEKLLNGSPYRLCIKEIQPTDSQDFRFPVFHLAEPETPARPGYFQSGKGN